LQHVLLGRFLGQDRKNLLCRASRGRAAVWGFRRPGSGKRNLQETNEEISPMHPNPSGRGVGDLEKISKDARSGKILIQ